MQIHNSSHTAVITTDISGEPKVSRSACREIVEKLLTSYANSDQPLKLSFDSFGKPSVDSDFPSFSYSHSNTLLVLVISSKANAIGVDTEARSRLSEINSLSSLAFSQVELRCLTKQDMLAAWCVKEAAVKQLGKGFRDANPTEFTVQSQNKTYTLSLSGNEILRGYVYSKFIKDDLVVICSDRELKGVKFVSHRLATLQINMENPK